MEIDCGLCLLRSWRASDAEAIARHANNRAVWRNLRDAFPHPYTLDDATEYIRIASKRLPESSLAIVVEGDPAGSVSLRVGTDVERISAEVGYWLGEAHWGRGIMTAAVRAATGYAHHDLGLSRVFALPFASNAASARVLEKAGYLREGVLRRSAIKDGRILDQYLYAALARE